MADHKNQNAQHNDPKTPDKGAPMTEQQKQAAESDKASNAPGSQEKQPGAPGSTSEKK